MKNLLRALLCAVAVAGATPLSANPGPTIVKVDDYAISIPADSTIRYVGKDKDQIHHFKGRFLVSGKFYYGNLLGYKKPKMGLYILLDAASKARLPTFKYIGDNPINAADSIYLSSAGAFGETALQGEVRERLMKKGSRYVTGYTAVWADNLGVVISCGVPSYGADFVSIYEPPSIRVTRKDGNAAEC